MRPASGLTLSDLVLGGGGCKSDMVSLVDFWQVPYWIRRIHSTSDMAHAARVRLVVYIHIRRVAELMCGVCGRRLPNF